MVGWSSADLLRTEPVADALGSACRERRPARTATFIGRAVAPTALRNVTSAQ